MASEEVESKTVLAGKTGDYDVASLPTSAGIAPDIGEFAKKIEHLRTVSSTTLFIISLYRKFGFSHCYNHYCILRMPWSRLSTLPFSFH